MSDKPLTTEERWKQAIGVERARYARFTDAFAQLGFSEKEIQVMLRELDDLENDPRETYPFTEYSAIYANERVRDEAFDRDEICPEFNEGVDEET
ncbi:MAG: hypothetical protein OXC80_05005 [Gammaproteobacteria bacterium]|nr:hypothetical protein [Gammaproteobacteria bacterium]